MRKPKPQKKTLLEIVDPPTEHIPPRCSHFGRCGGCRLQHLPYEKQFQWKEKAIQTLFSPLPPHEIFPIIAATPPWNYRNKMEYSFSSSSDGTRFLGLMIAAGRGKVIDIFHCDLTEPWFVNVLGAVRHWWGDSELLAYYPPKNKGSLRTLTLREGVYTGDKMVILTVSGHPDYTLSETQKTSFAETVRQTVEKETPSANLSIYLRIQKTAKGVPTTFEEILLWGTPFIREKLHVLTDKTTEIKALEFQISPSAFFQPNTRQAEKLYSRVLQMAQISPQQVVFDLYCGTGTLGLFAAHHAREVIGIELNAEAVTNAEENARLNGLQNIRFFAGDVGKVLKELSTKENWQKPDVVLVDPPRSGMDPTALQHLVALQAQKIVYVSCNPTTQAENIGALTAFGYQLTQLQPVDQFPHTVHVENIAVLTRAP